MIAKTFLLIGLLFSTSAFSICTTPSGDLKVELRINTKDKGMGDWHKFDYHSDILVTEKTGDGAEIIHFSKGRFKEDGAGNWDIEASSNSSKGNFAIHFGQDHEAGYGTRKSPRKFGGYYKNASGKSYDLSTLVCPGHGVYNLNNSHLRGRTTCYVHALKLLAATTELASIYDVSIMYWLGDNDIRQSSYASEATEVYNFENGITDSWEIELLRSNCRPISIKFTGDL